MRGGFSPDVQFNRQWLRTLMAQHRFSDLPPCLVALCPARQQPCEGGCPAEVGDCSTKQNGLCAKTGCVIPLRKGWGRT